MELDLIIPTHNRSKLLAECLRSVALAARPAGMKITVLVVDNNSTDDTRQTMDALISESDLPLKYLLVTRPGKSAALNDALQTSTADVIGLIDDDELLHHDWFQVVFHEFSDPAVEYIGGPCLPNWETQPPDWLPSAFRGAIGIVPRPARIAFSREFDGMLMGGNSAIRRTTLQKVLPYPENLGKIGKKIRSGEDEVIYHRLLGIGARGFVIPEMIIYHWIPAERLTRKYFRRWVVGRGISIGIQIRERGFEGPHFLGIQRYRYGELLRAIPTVVRSPTPKEGFTAQLRMLDCLATLYGRHFG